MRALLLTLALAACADPAQDASAPHGANDVSVEDALAAMPSWEGARAAGVDFRGIGQEPGWMLDIHLRDRIVLVWDYGENAATFPLTAPSSPQDGATRYETRADGRTVQITIHRVPCHDAMSGEPFPTQVEIVIDGRSLSGCGRSV